MTLSTQPPWLIVTGWVGRVALASVWIVEGFWAKVLGYREDEIAIVASTGIVGDGVAATMAIGIAETLLGLAVLLPWMPKAVALVQTLVIVGFNAAGLLFGGGMIDNVPDLLSKNAAILALAWIVALVPRRS